MTISAWTSLVNIWDYNVYWANIVQIAIVCAILLVSNAIRRKVKFIRNSLMPTAIIGGFLGLGIKYLLMGIADWTNIPEIAILTNDFLGVITYHALALGFIAIGLREVEKNKETGKAIGRPIKSGLFIVCNYVLQGILGLVITIGLSFVFTKVAPYAGVLLPMGYGQGPGQAFNIGTIFQTAGFEGGQSYGLMIATMGFVSASVGGVIYLNRKNEYVRLNLRRLTFDGALFKESLRIGLPAGILHDLRHHFLFFRGQRYVLSRHDFFSFRIPALRRPLRCRVSVIMVLRFS